MSIPFNNKFIDLNNDLFELLKSNKKFHCSLLGLINKEIPFKLMDNNFLNKIIAPMISQINDGGIYRSEIVLNRDVIISNLIDRYLQYRWKTCVTRPFEAFEEFDIYFCELIHEIIQKYRIEIILVCSFDNNKKILYNHMYYTYDKINNKYKRLKI